MADHQLPCPPADPHPRPPKIKAPPGSCDTHAHVFADRYPLSGRGSYSPPEASYEAYRHLLATLGVTRGVLSQPSVYGTNNAAILDAVARDPANLRAVPAVEADVTDEQIQALHAAGARGIRVNLVDKGGMPFASFDEVARLAARIEPLGWHIEYLVHVHEFDQIEVLADMPVDAVVGHFGYTPAAAGIDDPGYRRFLDVFEKGRIWVKLTAPYRITAMADMPYEDIEPFARVLREARPDRLLWGSDWPHAINRKPMANDGDMFDLLGTWLPDEALRAQVLAANPGRLYGFD